MARRASHRTEHGGTAFEPAANMLQPQDGVTRSADRAADAKIRLISPLGSLVSEPEDARITGGTRSLMRRALGLNFGTIKPERKIVAKRSVSVVKPVAA